MGIARARRPERADGVRGFVDAAGEVFGGLLALGRDRNVRAFLRQPYGQRFADAAAGAGDHGHAAVQVGMKNAIGIGHGFIEVSIGGGVLSGTGFEPSRRRSVGDSVLMQLVPGPPDLAVRPATGGIADSIQKTALSFRVPFLLFEKPTNRIRHKLGHGLVMGGSIIPEPAQEWPG